MFKPFIFVFVILLTACSHNADKPSNEVTQFVNAWSKHQNRMVDVKHKETYTRYLASVEQIYKNAEMYDQFNFYLQSLNANNDLLVDRQEKLPAQYKREHPRRIPTSRNFGLYKTKQMTQLYDNIYTQRELKLRDDLGENVYQKLRNNHAEFTMDEEARQYAFPL